MILELTSPAPESLTIDPAPPRWLDTLRARPALTKAHRTFRHELGLPSNGHIVMTGHQAEFWHMGILAKYFAADAAARASTAAGTPTSPAWLVVDHDTNDPGHVRIPVRRHDRDAEIDHLAELSLHLATATAPGLPVCETPALRPTEGDLARVREEPSPTPEIDAGIHVMLALLRRHADAPNAAKQHARVLHDLLAPFDLSAPLIHATSLARTSLFRDVIARMTEHPEACVAHYNAAVAAVPEAGLTPLTFDTVQDRFELPLWHIRPNAPRVRVYAEDLPAIPPDRLAPRALFMTSLLRLAGCDLFIHGLGGGIYDRATELWLRSWMPQASLAPTSVVSATRRLQLPPPASAEPLPLALWKLHHARHDPSLLDDEPAAAHKRDLVRRIAEAKASGENPWPLYRVMLTLLQSVRERHAPQLASLALSVQRSRASLKEQAVRADRTWPFPLHGECSLRALQHEINAAFAI